MKGYLSLDVDVSPLEVNQCDKSPSVAVPGNEIAVFRGSHKCHNETTLVRNQTANLNPIWGRSGFDAVSNFLYSANTGLWTSTPWTDCMIGTGGPIGVGVVMGTIRRFRMEFLMGHKLKVRFFGSRVWDSFWKDERRGFPNGRRDEAWPEVG